MAKNFRSIYLLILFRALGNSMKLLFNYFSNAEVSAIAEMQTAEMKTLFCVSLERARAKHPEFVYNSFHYYCALAEEWAEFIYASVFQDMDRARQEMVDILVLFERRKAGDGGITIPWWNPQWIIRAWTTETKKN